MLQSVTMVLTTVPDAETADVLVREALEARLAACVQRALPVRSSYRWQDKVESAEEYTLTFKTSPARAVALMALIGQRHPYDVPEIVSWTVEAAASYAQWVHLETVVPLHV
ncbi:divalent-cation tolerance protein CutA [Pararobbsia silviterrae]|uniref:Divalent-cation tolerance protein CutA n=1 Tax=Pararobbsia silviterrae TaxID=1792498 RepID=A0A494XBC7_9BURK|nr:divalent-cation tolerance protein CutA [Pararobbsia silviterrae]RKP45786.1 divalent-cation tolerance protein CutA [Pararobbsia silviterrae]